MDEQTFIYSKLKYLTDSVEILTGTVEKQSKMIGKLTEIIEQMMSPEYASKQAKIAEMVDVAEKIKYMRELGKNLR